MRPWLGTGVVLGEAVLYQGGRHFMLITTAYKVYYHKACMM